MGTLTSGDLDISLNGAERVQAKSSPTATPTTVNPATYLAAPGSVVTFSQPMTTTLEGDNMSGVLSTSWRSAASLPDGVSASYHLENADGSNMTAETPVGQPVTVDNLPNEKARPATIVVTLDFASAGHTWAADTSLTEPAPVADFGQIDIDLDQVRTGAGFTP